ncbi:hypothetical protein BGZ76_003636 [Entomortierella beljakovae]|nr:hypothetical protein BGZ76_003636 [Entomortierella beljakovae]
MANFSHKVGIPIFGAQFTIDDNLIIAGGGGASRTGVQNKIIIYKINTASQTLDTLVEKILSRDEDAPMSICAHPEEPALVCGINSEISKIEKGENENCRSKGTLVSRDQEDYQRVVRFNSDGSLLATGGTDGVFAIIKYPSLVAAFPITQFKGHSILDLDFSEDGEHIAVVSTQNLWIVSAKTGRVLEVITNPVLNKRKVFEFRKCRFGTGMYANVLYTVVNGGKNSRPFICMWNTATWTRIRTLTVGAKPVTALAISHDGRLLALGSADLSIRICSSKTLKVLMTVPKAHDFPVTGLAFNKDSTVLVSGSVDTTCRVVAIPKTFPTNNTFAILVISLMFLFLAVLIQLYQFYKD